MEKHINRGTAGQKGKVSKFGSKTGVDWITHLVDIAVVCQVDGPFEAVRRAHIQKQDLRIR